MSCLGGVILCSIPSKMNALGTLLDAGSYRSRFTPLSPFPPIIFHFLTWLTKQNGRNVDQREGEELYRLLGLIAATPIFPNFRAILDSTSTLQDSKAHLPTFVRPFLARRYPY